MLQITLMIVCFLSLGYASYLHYHYSGLRRDRRAEERLKFTDHMERLGITDEEEVRRLLLDHYALSDLIRANKKLDKGAKRYKL
jgi:hypothetical protein